MNAPEHGLAEVLRCSITGRTLLSTVAAVIVATFVASLPVALRLPVALLWLTIITAAAILTAILHVQ